MKQFTLKVKNKIKRLSLKEGQNPKQKTLKKKETIKAQDESIREIIQEISQNKRGGGN